jgi:Spy/CpxP family protein refolding chaperone
MKRFITTALVLAASLTAALPSFAAGLSGDAQFTANVPANGQSCSTHSCGKMEHGGKRMNLSDDQLEKLRALKDQYSVATSTKKAELKSLRSQEFEALSKPTVERDSLMAIQSKINSLQSELGNARVSMMADASGIFTPEQRQEMRHRFLTHGGFHGGGHRHGFGHERNYHGKFDHKSATT